MTGDDEISDSVVSVTDKADLCASTSAHSNYSPGSKRRLEGGADELDLLPSVKGQNIRSYPRAAKRPNSSNALPNLINTRRSWTPTQSFEFWILRIKGQIIVPINRVHQPKISVENSWIDCIHFEYWKHINRKQTTYKRSRRWSKYYHSAPKLLRKTDHERTQNLRRTSDNILTIF